MNKTLKKRRNRRIRKAEFSHVYRVKFDIGELLWQVGQMREINMINDTEEKMLVESINKTADLVCEIAKDLEQMRKDLRCPTQ